MSLIMSFCTPHGIVMGADRCITTTLTSGSSFCHSVQERKLFLAQNGFGFSYCGNSTFRDLPASYWMNRLIQRFSSLDLNVADFTLKLCLAFHVLDPVQNIIIIGSGYQHGKPQVYSANSTKRELIDHLNGQNTCISFAGESDLARTIIDAKPIDRKRYTIPDAIDFTKHVILTVSNIQKFAQTPKTVSPDCDILVILDARSQWIEPPAFI